MKKLLQTFFTLLLLTVCATGWAQDQTWSFEWNTTKANGGVGFYNFGSSRTDSPTATETFNGVTWTATLGGGATTFAYTSSGQYLGYASDPASTAVLTTSGITGTKKKITVTARGQYEDQGVTLKVKVGDMYYQSGGAETVTLGNTLTPFEFTAPADAYATGDISIEFAQPDTHQSYIIIYKIEVVYENTGSEPVATAPADPVIARTGSSTSDYMTADEDIVISTETEGATIYYTMDAADATTPKDPKTSDERTEYTAPITVTKSVKIRAVAFKDEQYSSVVERTFYMYKNPQLVFEGNADDATVQVGYVGIPVAVSNPYNVGPLTWSSDDETIATVDADGTVHALKEGQTNINFYFDGDDAYLEMGGRLKLYVEAATEEPTFTEGNYTFTWDTSRTEGGEGFYNFGSSYVDTNTLTATLNEVNWTANLAGDNRAAYTANNGQAFGAATTGCSHVELLTDGLSGQITEVKVKAKKGSSSADLSNAALKVSVNGEAYLNGTATEVPLTADFVEYSFKPAATPQEGTIKIEVNQTSDTKVVLYFKSIAVNYRIEETGISAPTASVAAGSYDEAQSVELSADEGATIYFTTDGADPKTSATAQEYTAAIAITETTTLKAIAKQGDKYSTVAEFKYIIRKDAELSFEKSEITLDYSDSYYQGVWLNNPHNVSPITYTSSDESVVKLDGYADLWPIAPGEATITATFAGNEEYKPATASYKVTIKALEPLIAPTVSPAGGTFEGPVEVTITAGSDWGTRALTIWYSTTAANVEEMESDPTIWWPEGNDYTVNSKTITISESCTLIVETRGYNSLVSEPVIATFTITPASGIAEQPSFNTQHPSSDTYYDLQGRPVSKVSKGGVYITNGKKVFIK